MGCLLVLAYVALLNILSVFYSPRKDVKYTGLTIFLIIFCASLTTAFGTDIQVFELLDESCFLMMLTLVTLTIVFLHEKTLDLVGFSLHGIGKSILWGVIVGLVECFIWGNFNIQGEMAMVTDISAGEIILLAPLSEEIFFRGFLHRYFRTKKKSHLRCAVYTSLIWMVIHFYGFRGSVMLFSGGLLLSWVRVTTGSLAGPIIMHFVWNLFAL